MWLGCHQFGIPTIGGIHKGFFVFHNLMISFVIFSYSHLCSLRRWEGGPKNNRVEKGFQDQIYILERRL